MRFFTRSPGDRYLYPCSKADVKSAFGEETLGSVCFGLRHEFSLDARYSPRPEIEGTVIMVLAAPRLEESTPDTDGASLYVFRVLKQEFDERSHVALVDLMKGRIREWLDAKIHRPVTEIFGLDELLVEFRHGQLVLHETRFR